MRWLSLVFAFVLLVAAIFGFFGGLGPLMAIGDYSEAWALAAPVVWAIAIAYLGVFYGGIFCCVVFFRGFRRAFAEALDRRPLLGDWLVAAGHTALAASAVNAALWRMQLVGVWDLFYLLLMVAAVLYSAGLGALALTLRSTGPASGGPVNLIR